MTEWFTPERIAGTFAAHPELPEVHLRRLMAHGVSADAAKRPTPSRLGYVHFVEPASFEFDPHCQREGAERAFLALVRDRSSTAIDIAAWQPQTGTLATWLSRAWALGEEQAFAPRLSPEGDLPVWRTPLEWLQHDRRGIVLLAEHIAPCRIIGIGPLRAQDHEHAKEVRARLVCPSIRVLTNQESAS